MDLLIALFLILFEAIPEGLKNKRLAGRIEFLYRAVATLIIFMSFSGIAVMGEGRLLVALVGYLLLRYALFDYVYNLIAGNGLFYIGNTKDIDKFWQWFFRITRFPKNHFFGWTRLICLIVGVTLLIRGTF